jgi:hypothetical protein
MAAEAGATRTRKQPAAQDAAEQAPGDPAADALAILRAEVAELRQQAAQARAERAVIEAPQPPQRPALPVTPADPDIMGLPGIKPLRLTSDTDGKPVTRHPLFYIDGVAVTIPDEVSQQVSVNYMRIVGENTEQAMISGQSYLLREMLGEDGYQRLCDYKPLTREQLGWIIQMCNRIALGGLEVPKES